MKVLVVEDDAQILSFIEMGLREAGFDVEVSSNGDEGYELARSGPYSVIVLDIMLPGRDGLSILSNLRGQKNDVPVILLTARSEANERVQGLNLGADDYLCKPFFVEELVARIHALARRHDGHGNSQLQNGELSVNLLTREVSRGDRLVELTTREFSLLEILMSAVGNVVSRTQLLSRVWGYEFDPQTNIVDVNVQRLRKKLSEEGEEPLIETIRGVGYRMRALD